MGTYSVTKRLHRWWEIHRTEKMIASRLPPSPAQLVRLTDREAVWELRLPDGSAYYVRANGRADEADRFVVHVDADAFYVGMLRSTAVLRTSAHGSTCMARRDMHLDYKFARAVKGFARSVVKPVPLAEPVPKIDRDGRLAILIDNGITRTYWLLANGCNCFPVEVSGARQADLLAKHVGVEMVSFAALFKAGTVHGSSTATT